MDFAAFFNKYKKIFLVLGFLLVIVVIGYLIYTTFFKSVTLVPTPTPGATTTPGGLPTAGPGGAQVATTGPSGIPISPTTPTNAPVAPVTGAAVSPTAFGGVTKTTALNNAPSLDPTLSGDGNGVQYYNQNDGKFYKLDANGNMIPLSDKVFFNVDKVDWAPNKSKAVLEYPDGSKIMYDFNTNKQVTLPKHWEDFDFSKDSSQLVSKSIGVDPENRWLITSNADGSQARALEFIGNNADSVTSSWSPNNQSVALYTEGVDFNRQNLYFVGQNGENFKSTVIEGRGLQAQWSKQGDRLLYSVYNADNNLNPKLWVVDAQGDNIGNNRQDLGIDTWANKCAFADNTNIYCAVPDNLQPGSGLVPDLALQTQDSLYKIDTTTGAKTLVATPDGKYNISNLSVSGDGKNLFFSDATTKQIYKINLK